MKIPNMTVSVVMDRGHAVDLRPVLDEPKSVAKLAKDIIGHDEREHLLAFILDIRCRVKSYSVVSIGTVSASLFHPREVFRAAVVSGGSAVVLCHNHPSGDTNPSPDDKETTKRCQRAGEILGIALLDHIIMTDLNESYFSFKNAGLIP